MNLRYYNSQNHFYFSFIIFIHFHQNKLQNYNKEL